MNMDESATSSTSISSSVSITVNGTNHHVPNPDPTMLLSTYLRDVLHLKGAKVCCGSGRCGTCTVLFSPSRTVHREHTKEKKDAPEKIKNETPSLVPINSCLRLLISCHKCIVVTPEGLGGSCNNKNNKEFHAIQKTLADGNGVQCGFCSPGFTLSAMGYWIEKYENNESFLSNDESDDVLRLQLEEYLDGNVCRCTGYRPILESLGGLMVEQKKSQCPQLSSDCKDVNLEDSDFVPYKRWGVQKRTLDIEDSHSALSCSAKHSEKDCKSECKGISHGHEQEGIETSLLRHYYRPTSLTEFQRIYSHLRNELKVSKPLIQIKAANTASGIRIPTAIRRHSVSNINQAGRTVKIDINDIGELRECRFKNGASRATGLIFGALTTLSTMAALLRRHSNTTIGPSKSEINLQDPTWEAAANHLNSIGNTQIRAAGTWAGNLMVSLQHNTFVSDVVMVLIGLDARVSFIDLRSQTETKDVPVSELRRRIGVEGMSSTFFVSLYIPRHANLSARSLSGKQLNEVLPPVLISRTYKVSSRQRNSSNHISCFISAYIYVPPLSMRNLNIEHDDGTNSPSSVITCLDARVTIVGVTPFVLEAKECASAMIQWRSSFDDEWLQSCLDGLDRDIELSCGVMRTGSTSSSFRQSVAQGLMYKFFLSIQNHVVGKSTPAENELARRSPVASKYTYSVYKEKFPVSYPIPNLDSRLLSSGEAKFTLDYEQPQGSFYGALIVTTHAGVEFKAIGIEDALDMDGVVDILTAEDIPARNSIVKKHPIAKEDDEFLFLEPGSLVPCVGTCLGVVVCRTRKQAESAAKRIPVYYDSASNNQYDNIFSLTAAIKANSIFETPSAKPLTRGNITEGLNGSPFRLSGRVSTGGQKHFYLENQNAIATPLEGGKLTLRSGTQSVTATQTVVSNILGIPAHKVNVVMKRTGGAFGGKITRSIHCAAAASIAATKLNRSVHVANSRDTDQCMVGGREPLVVDYDVGFDSEGRILAMSLKLHMDGGCTKDDSESDLILALRWCDHCYYVPHLEVSGILYRTNLTSNTACRAPGSVQACYVIDTILNRVAKSCGVTLQQCQEANFYQKGQRTLAGDTLHDDTLQKLWESLLVSSNINQKRAEIEKFNSKNRWRKRGLGLTPCKYGVVGSWFKEIAKVCIFACDGSVEINHSGAEMGQGIDTKVAQTAAMALGIPIDWIVTGEKSSNSQPNTFGTKASGTSELCCAAILHACSTLNEKLDQYKKLAIDECDGDISASDLFLRAVQAADKDRVCLSAEGWSAPHIPQGSTYQYYVYCAAAVEVEMDILTGTIELRHADITYDCGNQLNASIDIGQIEGGFVMGLGYFLTEKVTLYDGKLLSRNTSEYEPFGGMDIPTEMHICLFENNNSSTTSNEGQGAVLRSKATGEPPLICASAAHFAIREAIGSARKDMGNEEVFDLEVPATVEVRHRACLVDRKQFTLSESGILKCN